MQERGLAGKGNPAFTGMRLSGKKLRKPQDMKLQMATDKE